VFGLLFNIVQSSGAFVIEEMEIDLDSETALLQILRTPLAIDSYKTDVAGQLIYAKGNRSRIIILMPEIESLLQDIVDKTSMDCVMLQIDGYYVDKFGNAALFEIKVSEDKGADACTYGSVVAEQQLPGHGSRINIKLFARNEKKR